MKLPYNALRFDKASVSASYICTLNYLKKPKQNCRLKFGLDNNIGPVGQQSANG